MKKNWAKHNLKGINWSATDHNYAPNKPAYSSSKGKPGRGNPQKDMTDRLAMAGETRLHFQEAVGKLGRAMKGFK